MRPRTPIRPQPIKLMNQTKTTHVFTRKFINIWCVMEIEVASQNLITSLTREYISTCGVLLDVLAEKPHWCTRPHRRRVIGLEGVDHVVDVCETLRHCKFHLCVFSTKIVCNRSSSLEVRTSL